jgi:hypothetical protein
MLSGEGRVVDRLPGLGLAGGIEQAQVVDSGGLDRVWRVGFDRGAGRGG